MIKKRILIADDVDLNRDLMVQILETEYEVMVAIDGEEAVKKAEMEKPDLILMDLRMPVLDGWEATKRIKTTHDLKGIPVIAITSHAMVGDETKAREIGCDDYLAKPIDEDVLLSKIRRILGG